MIYVDLGPRSGGNEAKIFKENVALASVGMAVYSQSSSISKEPLYRSTTISS